MISLDMCFTRFRELNFIRSQRIGIHSKCSFGLPKVKMKLQAR